MDDLFANSRDPHQTPHCVVSDLGLHCLPVTLLGVSRLQWVKNYHFVCQQYKLLRRLTEY